MANKLVKPIAERNISTKFVENWSNIVIFRSFQSFNKSKKKSIMVARITARFMVSGLDLTELVF